MTKPTEPLWRMAIPISPTEKSYRPTHRAGGSRGCVAWDMSYISTIGCQGPEASLEGLLKSLQFAGEGWQGAKFRRWKSGSRSSEGWAFRRDNDKSAISPIRVIWCAQDATSVPNEDVIVADAPAGPNPAKPKNRRFYIRVHPSAFHRIWLEVIKVAKMQRPQVLLEDLRFEISTIDVTGPGSTEALLGVLNLAESGDARPAEVWSSLAGLTNPASLPANAIMCFDITDPRLRYPPSQIVLPKEDAALSAMNEMIVSWPPDKAPTASRLFAQKWRHLAASRMLSQKAINRRKAELASGERPASRENDPRIPVMLAALRPQQGSSNAQGTWTVMLPWKCLDSVWRSLMYYNLTSGGTPRFGGLDQKRQVLFEHGQPWFPADFPGTEAGQAWERTQSEERFDIWMRRPPSRRIAWETVLLGNGKKGEHGNGWACDWEYLLTPTTNLPPLVNGTELNTNLNSSIMTPSAQGSSQRLFTQRQRKAAKTEAEKYGDSKDSRRRNTSSPESEGADPSPIESDLRPSTKMLHMPLSTASEMLKGKLTTKPPSISSLTTVRVTFLTRGTPNPAARVYRLPLSFDQESVDLRKRWLSLDPAVSSTELPLKQSAREQKSEFKKDKLNRHGLRRVHSTLPKDPLSHVQYLPPDAHPDVVTQYGPKDELESSWPSVEERHEQLQQLMFPNMTHEERVKHPACPDASDLIGFVTTGAYNLTEGKGVAIASIWVQRVLEGWKRESAQNNAGDRKQSERERHLCIIRNAGEGVGRLAVWELC
jgi:ribonuclease P/MRP protein subunit POP1